MGGELLRGRYRVFVGVFLSWALFSCQIAGAVSEYDAQKQEANNTTLGVSAASAGGTYMVFAENLQDVFDDSKNNKIRVMPIVGRGGVQNIIDLLFLKGVDLAFTQQESLVYLKKEYPLIYANAAKRIRFVAKLYESEIHFVASPQIKSILDLDGKRIGLSKPLGPTDIAGRSIFDALGIKPIIVNMDPEVAPQKLEAGEIDAFAFVGGVPVNRIAQIKKASGAHFLPIDEQSVGAEKYAKLLEIYLPATLYAKDYHNLIEGEGSVPTLTSGTLLIAYEWPDNSLQAKKINKFVDTFFTNFELLLQPPHHPKWHETNLTAEVPGWTRLKSAQVWLDQHHNAVAKVDKMRVAFAKFIEMYQSEKGATPLTKEQTAQLWEKFQSWFNKGMIEK